MRELGTTSDLAIEFVISNGEKVATCREEGYKEREDRYDNGGGDK